MTDLIDAARTVILAALAWTAGAAILTAAAGLTLARVLHRRISR